MKLRLSERVNAKQTDINLTCPILILEPVLHAPQGCIPEPDNCALQINKNRKKIKKKPNLRFWKFQQIWTIQPEFLISNDIFCHKNSVDQDKW